MEKKNNKTSKHKKVQAKCACTLILSGFFQQRQGIITGSIRGHLYKNAHVRELFVIRKKSLQNIFLVVRIDKGRKANNKYCVKDM